MTFWLCTSFRDFWTFQTGTAVSLAKINTAQSSAVNMWLMCIYIQ